MQLLDVMLLILCLVTTVGFGSIFVIIVRHIIEDARAKKKNV